MNFRFRLLLRQRPERWLDAYAPRCYYAPVMSESVMYFRYFAFASPPPLWLGAEAIPVR